MILPRDFAIEGLNDSKNSAKKKRESLYGLITKEAVAYQICSVSEKEIDRLNILAASMLAIKKAVEGLSVRPDAAYIDGNRAPELEGIPAIPVVKGMPHPRLSPQLLFWQRLPGIIICWSWTANNPPNTVSPATKATPQRTIMSASVNRNFSSSSDQFSEKFR